MPILVKIEATDDENLQQGDQTGDYANGQSKDNTYNVIQTVNRTVGGKMNETITLEPRINDDPNATVTLDKNTHDSLMTDDLDDMNETSENIPLAKLLPKEPPQLPLLKLKKNEVFK